MRADESAHVPSATDPAEEDPSPTMTTAPLPSLCATVRTATGTAVACPESVNVTSKMLARHRQGASWDCATEAPVTAPPTSVTRR